MKTQIFSTLAIIGFAVNMLQAAPQYTFKIAFKNGAQKEFAVNDISKISFSSEVEEAKSKDASLDNFLPSSSSKEVKNVTNIKLRSVDWDANQNKLKIILDKPTTVDVDLHDMHGEIVASYSSYGSNGIAVFSFGKTKFPRGNYIAEIRAGNKSSTKQINLTK